MKIKDNAKLTNKQKDVISFDISRRRREESLIDDISTVYHINQGSSVSQFCNETDNTRNANRIQHSTSISTYINSRDGSKPIFNLICDIEYGDSDD